MAKSSTTKYVILGFLSHEPMTGYDIRKQIESQISYFWSDIKFGQIYPALAMLEHEGLATKKVEMQENTPLRKVYTITTEGREIFTHWLLQPIAKEQVKYEVLLKLFFGSQIPVTENIKRIEAFRARSVQNLQFMKQYAENLCQELHEEDHLYFLLAVLLGQHFYQAQLDWVDETIQLLENHVHAQ